VLQALDRELDLGALRAPDPLALLGLDGLGPVEALEVRQQALGIGGDAQQSRFVTFIICLVTA